MVSYARVLIRVRERREDPGSLNAMWPSGYQLPALSERRVVQRDAKRRLTGSDTAEEEVDTANGSNGGLVVFTFFVQVLCISI